MDLSNKQASSSKLPVADLADPNVLNIFKIFEFDTFQQYSTSFFIRRRDPRLKG